MQTRWIVCYDIADPARLRLVHRTLCGYGTWMQLSIFGCSLSSAERVRLQAELEAIIRVDEDQVLFIDVGPVEGRGAEAIQAIGKPMEESKRVIVV